MKSFYEIGWHDFQQLWNAKIEEEIRTKSKEYILNVDENEFCKYLHEKYTLEPLKIIDESEHINKPVSRTEMVSDGWGGRCQADYNDFKIEYNFEGSAILFQVKPTPCTVCCLDIEVNERSQTVSFECSVRGLDKDKFISQKNSCYSDAFTNINNVNNNIKPLNDNLDSLCHDTFHRYKESYVKENSFFEAINVKVNKDTKSVFTAPTVEKKTIPQPKATNHKTFVSEPTMNEDMYKDVLKVIYDSGKSMEKKPSLYKNKDEEALRDQFLFVLETRYEGTTATGETFNKCGKTDIILKYAADSSNLFVAECKFWHGASEFSKAINQLFDRYLTWSDSKVSVILFVNNKDFSSVITTIKNETPKHTYFLKEKGQRGETSFSYEFHLPGDKDKIVLLEVMAFHYI